MTRRKRKITNHKFQLFKESLENTLHIAHVGRWDWDASSGDTTWSDETYRILGLAKGTCRPGNESIWNITHPEDKTRVCAEEKRTLAEKAPFILEHRIIHPDGSIRHIRRQAQAAYDQEGRITRLGGMIMDISECKSLEQALGKKKESLESIQRMTHLGNWEWDIENDTVYWSPEMYRLYGMMPDEKKVTPKTLVEMTHPEDREYVRCALNRCISEGSPYKAECRVIRADGTLCDTLQYAEIYRDTKGQPTHMAGTCQDITELKSQSNAQEIRQMREENRLVIDFLNNISHEFKTPLSIILMQLELMRLYRDDRAKMEELVSNATQNSYRLARLVSNLLDITKIDSGFMQLNLRKTDLVETLREICEFANIYTKAKCIDIVFRTECPWRQFLFDAEKLGRVMLNLLSNAIKHTGAGGTIAVGLEDKTGSVVICVKDTGTGIPDDKKKRIFDRFFRVNTSLTRENEGCGIGLSLVKSLVELHAGRIWMESKLGEGSAFYIELPEREAPEYPGNIEIEGYDLKQRTEMELSDLYLVH